MDRPSRRLVVDHFESLQIVGFLLRIESILLLIPFIIFWSFLQANYLALSSTGAGNAFVYVRSATGMFLSLALFFCYLMVVLDYTARGHQQPPKISGDLIDRHKGKFFKSTLSLSFFASASAFFGGDNWLTWFMALTALLLPVVMAIISIQESFTQAMNPVRWFQFLVAIRWNQYVIYYGICYVALIFSFDWAISESDILLVVPAISSSALFALGLFRTIGILIHANADALGLSVQFSENIEQQQIEENRRRDESDFSAHLYRLTSADKTNQAWQEFNDYLGKADAEALDRFWPVISQWPNPGLSLRAGQVYVEKLVQHQSYGPAWQVLSHCFERNGGEFRLLSANATLALSACPENSQQRNIAAELLRFFDRDFPNHAQTTDAMLRSVELMLDENEVTKAKRLLSQLRIKFPDVRNSERYQRLLKLTELGS